jgi:arylsulfatase A-like enzyme
VFLKGSGFTGAVSVEFNGTPATFRVRSDTRIRALVPSGATSGPITVLGDSTAASPTPFTVQPNIVLIYTDDQRFDQLDRMPIVESELIGKGVQFSNGFVVNPLCCPSRATMLTGKYSHSTDVYSNVWPHGSYRTFVTERHEDRSTIATWLDKVGYRTGLVGKYINGYSVTKTSYIGPGWDVWDALVLGGGNGGEGRGGFYDYTMSIQGASRAYGSAPSDYSTDVLSGYATDFIRSSQAATPFFLLFTPRAPHGPATPAPRHENEFPNLPPLRPPSYNEDDVDDKPDYIKAIPQWSDDMKASQDQLYLDQYRSLLAVDDAVGEILDALADTGRLQDTLIVFASDNGLQFGEHRLIGKKVPYEESIRIPFVARYDAMTHRTATVDPRFVLNLDLAPTFAAAGGATAPNVEGRSFLPLLDGSASGWRRDFLIEHFDPKVVKVPTYCAVRNEDEIYVRYESETAGVEEELYDLNADPNQLTNVENDLSYALDKAALHDRLVELCDPPPPGYSP